MKKIAIIGAPGAGKTTLAKNLHRILNIKVRHLDRLFWQPGWIRIDRETRIDTMQSLICEKQWIIEGTYLYSSISRLKEADTIIFLDIPFYVCLYRIVKRHHKDHGRSRRDIPMESSDRLTMLRMLKVLSFPLQGRKTLMRMLSKYDSKQIIWLQSHEEVNGFLAQLEQENKRVFSSPTKKEA